MNKLAKILIPVAIGLSGAGLMVNSCASDAKYEEKMVEQGKYKVMEEKGTFKNTLYGAEYVAGVLLLGAAYRVSKLK